MEDSAGSLNNWFQFYLPVTFSAMSLAVSAFVAGWTVYRDAIRRPKFRVDISIQTAVPHHGEPVGPDTYVNALNLGPMSNKAEKVVLYPGLFTRWRNKKSIGVPVPDFSHPYAKSNVEMVEMGNDADFIFSIKQSSDFLEFRRIGVVDGYGNIHWAKNKTFSQFKQQLKSILNSNHD